ncbi:MAG: TIR domain-containing protein [Bacteroidota bacterium]
MDVFISHNHRDKSFTNRLNDDLQKKGIKTWYDSEALNIGDSLTAEVIKGIKDSKYFLIVLSENSISSKWVKKELDARLDLEQYSKKTILPVLLGSIEKKEIFEEIRKLEPLYANFQDLNNYNSEFNRIKNTIRPPIISEFDNEQIRQMISKGKTEAAIKELLSIIPEKNDFYNQIVLLSSQLQGVNRNHRMGIMGFSEYSREQSKITMSTLQIISEINES